MHHRRVEFGRLQLLRDRYGRGLGLLVAAANLVGKCFEGVGDVGSMYVFGSAIAQPNVVAHIASRESVKGNGMRITVIS